MSVYDKVAIFTAWCYNAFAGEHFELNFIHVVGLYFICIGTVFYVIRFSMSIDISMQFRSNNNNCASFRLYIYVSPFGLETFFLFLFLHTFCINIWFTRNGLHGISPSLYWFWYLSVDSDLVELYIIVFTNSTLPLLPETIRDV